MKIFTKEEIQILSANPNTHQVSESRLTLNLDAKKHIMELANQGHSALYIMKELGYDIAIIGETRAKSIVKQTKKQSTSDAGLHEGYKARPPKRATIDELQQLPLSEETFVKLRNEVVYLRQEVDFLKKISSAVNQKKRGNSQ